MKPTNGVERGIPPRALYWNGYIMMGVGVYATLLGYLEENIGAYLYAGLLLVGGLYARRKGLRGMKAQEPKDLS